MERRLSCTAHSTRRLMLSCVIVGCVACGVGLLIAHANPARGFEWSLYASVPAAVWFLCFGAGVIGLVVLLWGGATQRSGRGFWLAGIAPALLSKAAIVAIPYARGYVGWRGDSITHMGIVRDIVTAGRVAVDDFYPISHVLVAVQSMVSGLDVAAAYNLGPSLFIVVHGIAIWAVAWRLFGGGARFALCVGLALPMFAGFQGTPNAWSLLWMPFVVLVASRAASWPTRVLCVLLVGICPLFHPLTALMLVGCLASGAVVMLTVRRLLPAVLGNSTTAIHCWAGLAALGFIVFWRWIESFKWFESNIRTLVEQMLSWQTVGTLATMEGSLGRLGLNTVERMQLFVRMYGADTIGLLFGAFGVGLLVCRIVRGHQEPLSAALLGVVVCFCTCVLWYGAYMLGAPGSGAIAGGRGLAYAVLFAPFAGALVAPRLAQTKGRVVLPALVLVVSLAFVLEGRALFCDPYVQKPNVQVSQMDVEAVRFVGEKKASSQIVLNCISNPPRVAEWAFGKEEAASLRVFSRGSFVPDHFGYNLESNAGDTIGREALFLLGGIDRTTYSTVWKAIGRFDSQDFVRLESDTSCSLVYATRGVDVNLAMPLASTANGVGTKVSN